MDIKSTINLEGFQKNSLIIIKVDPETVKSQGEISNLARNIDDLKKKWDMDDTVGIWATPHEINVKTLDEQDMKDLGWVRG